MKTAVEPRFERIFATVPAVLLFILIAAAAPPADGAPEPEGWYAGDMHVHRSCGGSPESVTSLRTKMSANNLRVMSLLADMGNGEVQDPVTDLPLVTGWDAPESTDSRMIRWDTEWHWDATYGQFAHQALGGHIIALGLTDAQQVWEEYTYPVLEWAHQRNGIAGFAHMQYLDDGIPQSLNCCIPIEYPVEVALGAADFISEDVTGSNAAINAYYRLLNTGFRPGFAAGTDYPCGVSTLGSLLTYVQIPPGQPMTYEAWIDGIQQGRTVVSRNGHEEFLDLQVNGDATPGDEIALSGGDSIPVDVIWTATQTITGGRIELVHDGIVVASEQATVTPTTPVTLTAIVDFANSGWLAARRMDAAGEHRLQTGAVFVIVDGKPVRVSADDANFYVQWMDNLLTRTSPGGAWASYFTDEFSSDNPTCPPEGCRAAAQARYSQAKAIYQQIALEAEATPPPPPSADCAQLAALEQRIWSDSTPPPAIFSDSDTSAVELGVKFQTGVAGCITGLRFYKGGTSNTGPHVGHLWTENGQLLATATFSNESSSGWQQATLATPVSVDPGTTYVASYHAPGGHYSVNDGYFGTAVDSGDLTALADGASDDNGVYAYGPPGSFPTRGYLQSNYWVDVVFRANQ